MSLNSSMSIGRQGLYVAQLGLQITGANVANVNTEGYKRQQVVQSNLPYGLGVTVQSIDRILNRFSETRLLQHSADAYAAKRVTQSYAGIEDLFNEIATQGIDAEFQAFFKSLQDLADDPSGAGERATLRSAGDGLGDVMQFYYNELEDQIEAQDLEIETIVREINGILKTVAGINRQLGATFENKIGYNELLNERDAQVRRLAQLMPVTVVEDARGAFTLYIKEDLPLVEGTNHMVLEAVPDPTDDLQRDVFWVAPGGARFDVTDAMTTGALGGALKVRDQVLPEQTAKLDRLAAEFVRELNAVHRAGTGLDGVSGRDFFEPLSVYTHVSKGAQGGAGVTAASVLDQSLLTLDAYEIRFTSAANYEVVNTTTGATAASGAYAPGGAIVFDGVSVTIDDVSGAPQAGDFFHVDTVTGAAKRIAVGADVTASLDAIAAGFTGETGDNRNALALADLDSAKILQGGTMGVRDFYNQIIVELGVAAAEAGAAADSRDMVLRQTENMIESVSGVNLDEEATRMMSYQRAFQASSKVITTVDAMMETVINMI